MRATSITGIVNYGLGNVHSVQSAVEKVGGSSILTADHETLLQCDRLILPGVGAFSHGMAELEARGLSNVLHRAIEEGRPVLGICLGMQMLMQRSLEFGDTAGLGLTAGTITIIEPPEGAEPLRLPHVACKPLRLVDAQNWFFEGVDRDARFYFIHSYAAQGNDTDVLAWANHDGVEFAAAVARGNVIGTQFHLEKSGPDGLKLLSNFISRGK